MRTISEWLSILLKNKIIRFIISGGTAAFVLLSTLYIFTEFLHIYYILSSILGFGLSVSVNFFLQKKWVFNNHSRELLLKQAYMFLSISLFNLVLNTFLMYTLVDILNVWYLLSQILIAGIIAIWNFLTYRIIFNKDSSNLKFTS